MKQKKNCQILRNSVEIKKYNLIFWNFNRVPADMPLYDILNEFQKGGSHMAAVVRAKDKTKNAPILIENEIIEDKRESDSGGMSNLITTTLETSNNVVIDVEGLHNNVSDVHHKLVPSKTDETAASVGSQASDDTEEGEVVGIITLEDVFEELLQVTQCFL